MTRITLRIAVSLAAGFFTTLITTVLCVYHLPPPARPGPDWSIAARKTDDLGIITGARSRFGGDDFVLITAHEGEIMMLAQMVALQTESKTVTSDRIPEPSFAKISEYTHDGSTNRLFAYKGFSGPTGQIIYDIARGFPWPAVHGRYQEWYAVEGERGWDVEIGHPLVETGWNQRGLQMSQPDEHVMLPTSPLWSGVAGNSLLYAGLWFVLFFGYGYANRAMWRKRGQCVRCGYDLRGSVTSGQDARSTGCPECGWGRTQTKP